MKHMSIVALLLLLEVASLAQSSTGTIAGLLVDKNAKPAANTRVSVLTAGAQGTPQSAIAGLTYTDSSGHYVLENIPPGNYYVVSGAIDAPTYFPGVSAITAARTVTIAAGARLTGIDFITPSVYRVAGRVVNPPQTIVTSVTLTGPKAAFSANAEGASNGLTAQIKENGSFEFANVRPGSYSARATILPTRVRTATQPFAFTVGERDVTDIELVITELQEQRGKAILEGGAGLLPPINITLVSFNGGSTITSKPGVDGAFTLYAPEGDYRVTWNNLTAGYTVRSITAGTSDLMVSPLKIAPNVTVPIVVTLGVSSPRPWVRVSGRVTGSTSLASITSLQLTADSSSIPNVATKVGPDGAFEFPMVLPGAYTVRISPTLPVAALVVGSKDLRDVEIAIPPFKTVSGRVKVEGTVAAAPRLTFSLPGSLTTPNTTWAINQADGSFKVSLPLGEFPIQVEAAGFTVKALALGNVDGLQHPVLITTADSAEFKVTLTPLPGVSAPMPLAPFASLIPGEDPFAPSTAPISGGVRIDTVSGERTTFGSLSSFDPPRALQTDKALRLLTDALAPRVIRRVEPEYPEVARVARIEGEVSMRVSIADDGTPRDIIVESGHPSLREAAVKAVRQWLFEPDDAFALRTATIIVDFRLPPTPNP